MGWGCFGLFGCLLLFECIFWLLRLWMCFFFWVRWNDAMFFLFKCFVFLVNSCECLQRFSIVSFDVETHTTKLMVFKLPDQPNVHVWSYFWLLSSVFYYLQEVSIQMLVYLGALEFRMLPPIPKNKYPSMYTFPEKPKVEFFWSPIESFWIDAKRVTVVLFEMKDPCRFYKAVLKKNMFFWGEGLP